MQNPKITVIIPAYNAASTIEDCLLSICEQTVNAHEILVVDDGSNDQTRDIAGKYATVISSPQNRGAGAARNLGAKNASGQVLVFTDSDVVVPNNWLEKILHTMQQHDSDCVGGGYCGSIGDSKIELFQHFELLYRRKNIRGFVDTLVSNNFACKRDIFVDTGGFIEEFKAASTEDLILSFKISRNHKIYWNPDNGVYHNFRKSLRLYLKQQYIFGKDTLVTYCMFPELFFVKTHQGRGLYLETLLTGAMLALLPVVPLASIVALFFILLYNINFISYLNKNAGLNFFFSLRVILARNIICVLSIASGGLHALPVFFKRIFNKKL